MLSMLEKTLNRNMLKYAAGTAIFCKICNRILDHKTTVIAESPAGQNHIVCLQCFNDGLQKVHDDSPIQYLRDIGWNITMPEMPKPKKPGNRFPDSLIIRTPAGTQCPDPIPAKKAFKMFGHQFYVHGRIGHDLKPSAHGFTVSHSCGAAIAYGDNMAATIRAAKAKLELNGEAKFLEALGKVSP